MEDKPYEEILQPHYYIDTDAPPSVEGIRMAQCTVCLEVFNAPSVFDMHVVWGPYYIIEGKLIRPIHPNYEDHRCLSAEEMEAIGMRKNPLGRWTGGAMSPAAIRQLQGYDRIGQLEAEE